MIRLALILAGSLALAGCAAVGEPHGGSHGAIDTGDIAPGESRVIAFDEAGRFALHCHPHPFMEQAVHVTDEPPSEVHVHIVDGSQESDDGFEPTDITVGKGSLVTYHDHGMVTHTATLR